MKILRRLEHSILSLQTTQECSAYRQGLRCFIFQQSKSSSRIPDGGIFQGHCDRLDLSIAVDPNGFAFATLIDGKNRDTTTTKPNWQAIATVSWNLGLSGQAVPPGWTLYWHAGQTPADCVDSSLYFSDQHQAIVFNHGYVAQSQDAEVGPYSQSLYSLCFGLVGQSHLLRSCGPEYTTLEEYCFGCVTHRFGVIVAHTGLWCRVLYS